MWKYFFINSKNKTKKLRKNVLLEKKSFQGKIFEKKYIFYIIKKILLNQVI